MGQILRFIKNWTLLFAIIIGIIGAKWWYILATTFTWLLPTIIFLMLILSLSKIDDAKPQKIKLHVIFILLQTFIGISFYYIFKSYNLFLAQGLIMIIFGATANASPVVVSLMGGKIDFSARFVLIDHIYIALIAPVLFPLIGNGAEGNFLADFLTIVKKIIPTVVLPLSIILLLKRFSPKAINAIRSVASFSYYFWAFAITLIIGQAFYQFINSNIDINFIFKAVALAFFCFLFQWGIGRYIGSKFNETIAGGQALAQKNVILSIWLAQMYFSPEVIWLPICYILAQNTINSIQISLARRGVRDLSHKHKK